MRFDDETLREYGKAKHEAKRALAECCRYSHEEWIDPNLLFDVMIGPLDDESFAKSERKVRRLFQTLRANPYTAAPPTAFIAVGAQFIPWKEAAAQAQADRKDAATRKVKLFVIEEPTAEEMRYICEAAEISCGGPAEEVLKAHGAQIVPCAGDFEDYYKTWFDLAMTSGNLSFLQAGLENTITK